MQVPSHCASFHATILCQMTYLPQRVRLVYGEPIHRMREFGVIIKELDMIDEVALSGDQIVNVIKIM